MIDGSSTTQTVPGTTTTLAAMAGLVMGMTITHPACSLPAWSCVVFFLRVAMLTASTPEGLKPPLRMLQAALDAVNEADILTADIDYAAKGRELQQRRRQQQQQQRQDDSVPTAIDSGSSGGGTSAAASMISRAPPGPAEELLEARPG